MAQPKESMMVMALAVNLAMQMEIQLAQYSEAMRVGEMDSMKDDRSV